MVTLIIYWQLAYAAIFLVKHLARCPAPFVSFAVCVGCVAVCVIAARALINVTTQMKTLGGERK